MKLAKRDSFWFAEKTITNIAAQYNAKYLGSWCIRNKMGNWSEDPVEVFYQPTPNCSKGHSHYFGIFYPALSKQLMICNAESAFSEPMLGILENDEVYTSRFRHDFIMTPEGKIIDGGRDYLHSSSDVSFVEVTVKDGEFIFTPIER
jgi:hypothetical protein